MSKLGSEPISILILLLIGYASPIFSQQVEYPCKVFLNEISGSYRGDCQDGVANGKGTATGEDSYTGVFKNGLPEGKGTYKYKNGNVFSGNWRNGLKHGKGEFKYLVDGKTTMVSGYWKDGDYTGLTKPDDDYRLTSRLGIEYYSIKRTESDKNLVEITFENTRRKYIPVDLIATISSGYELVQGKKIIMQDFSSPLRCSLQFTIQTGGGIRRQCSLEFDVLRPGKYEVFISN